MSRRKSNLRSVGLVMSVLAIASLVACQKIIFPTTSGHYDVPDISFERKYSANHVYRT